LRDPVFRVLLLIGAVLVVAAPLVTWIVIRRAPVGPSVVTEEVRAAPSLATAATAATGDARALRVTRYRALTPEQRADAAIKTGKNVTQDPAAAVEIVESAASATEATSVGGLFATWRAQAVLGAAQGEGDIVEIANAAAALLKLARISQIRTVPATTIR